MDTRQELEKLDIVLLALDGQCSNLARSIETAKKRLRDIIEKLDE